MTICKHFFIRIGDVTKLPRKEGETTPASWRGIPGAEAGCANCGQIRRIWTDGMVEIAVEGGKPIDEDTLTDDAD